MKITQAVHKSGAYIMLESHAGLSLSLSELGAGIYDVSYKGRHLVETPLDKDLYELSRGYYGKSVGRTAGRIKGGILPFEGRECLLDVNGLGCTLHGGKEGFSFRRFRSDIELLEKGVRVDFYLLSPDGEGGYPGELTLRIRYVLSDERPSFRIETKAVAKGDSLLNFTNHSYWNLDGDGNVLAHKLKIDCDAAMEYGKGLIPLGYRPIARPLDFTSFKEIGADIDDPSLIEGPTGGYDHSFRFRKEAPEKDRVVLKGRELELHVSTSLPSVQVYSDNFGDADMDLQRGGKWTRFGAVAIEPSFAPNDFEAMKIPSGTTQRTYIQYDFTEASDDR